MLLEYSTLAAFRGDKLIGWLNEADSKAYNYIAGNVKSTAGSLPCKGGGRMTMEVMNADSKIKASLKNGKPEITVLIQLENDIGEVQCNIDLTKMETIEQVEKDAEKGMVESGMRAVAYAKKRRRHFRLRRCDSPQIPESVEATGEKLGQGICQAAGAYPGGGQNQAVGDDQQRLQRKVTERGGG